MADELHTLCFLDPEVIKKYRYDFYVTLGAELRANAKALPCAFALMVIEPGDTPADIRFNILVGGVKELLPKGEEEVTAMLQHMLRKWEEANYPDKIILSDVVGTA